MADIQFTLDIELFQGRFGKSEGVAKLLEQILNEVLEAEVTEALGARRYGHRGVPCPRAANDHRTSPCITP